MTGRRRRAAAGLLGAALLGVAALADETEFAARLSEARQAVLSGAGKDFYEGAFSKAFHAQHSKREKRLKKCMKLSGAKEPANFNMLLQLSGDGRVGAALAYPASEIATCYLEEAKNDVYPKPPSPGF